MAASHADHPHAAKPRDVEPACPVSVSSSRHRHQRDEAGGGVGGGTGAQQGARFSLRTRGQQGSDQRARNSGMEETSKDEGVRGERGRKAETDATRDRDQS